MTLGQGDGRGQDMLFVDKLSIKLESTEDNPHTLVIADLTALNDYYIVVVFLKKS
jgi:hypothetical protein